MSTGILFCTIELWKRKRCIRNINDVFQIRKSFVNLIGKCYSLCLVLVNDDQYFQYRTPRKSLYKTFAHSLHLEVIEENVEQSIQRKFDALCRYLKVSSYWRRIRYQKSEELEKKFRSATNYIIYCFF